jgi:methyltransferase-like protein 6
MTKAAQEVLQLEGPHTASEMTYKRLEIDARRHWDIFYKNNTTNFYKDRHYLRREFAELADGLTQAKEEGR